MNILMFFIPPIAGAFIGYSTNVLAIKMLFRPINEVRIFGFRLPFTPGILPKQRYRLAQSIGSMVERELITPEILRNRLALDDVQGNIISMISQFTENILDKTPAEIFDGKQHFLTERIPGLIEKLYPAFSSAIMNFLHRDDIRRELELKGQLILSSIFLKLNTLQRFFLSAGQYDLTLQEKIPEIIVDLIVNAESFLKDDKIKKTLLEAASSSFGKIIDRENVKINELLDISKENKKELDDFLFKKLMSTVDGQIEKILSSINVKALVSDRIDSLDMVRVERIVLDVMSDQFKWVEIFGGILGFLIGLFQSGLNWFLR
jgi:uncharacterized membrane protein YheB (UPF0754 family)